MNFCYRNGTKYIVSKGVKLIPCLQDDWSRLRQHAVMVRTERILFGGSFLVQCLKVQLGIIWTNSQWDDIGKDVCELSRERQPLPILSEHNSVKVTPLLKKERL